MINTTVCLHFTFRHVRLKVLLKQNIYNFMNMTCFWTIIFSFCIFFSFRLFVPKSLIYFHVMKIYITFTQETVQALYQPLLEYCTNLTNCYWKGGMVRTEMGLQWNLPDTLLFANKLHGALHRAEQRRLLSSFTLKRQRKACENCYTYLVLCFVKLAILKWVFSLLPL